jgi:enoyl-CoA hydratase/carnithine racemase
MSQVVNFQEIECNNGKKIAFMTLNSPKSLNALSVDMINLIYPKLTQWKAQENIVAVFLQGKGDKAFCAGGDIVHIYNDMISDIGDFTPNLENYFTMEYELDHFIHTFNKPFIVWGNGIVMGGGLGLMVGGSHRVVTENSRIAMPEVSIGFYPDVGGSYFLNRMPNQCGMFLGLTGALINAADAKYCHLADYFVTSENKGSLIEQLVQIDWQDSIELNHEKLSSLLTHFEKKSGSQLPESKLTKHETLIKRIISFDNLKSIVDEILAVETDDNWFGRAQKSLKNGSPLSAALTFQQIRYSSSLSLADCFRMELNLSVKSGKFGEFSEGVRALLIDNDYSPKWHFSSIDTIDEKVVDWFFESKWAQEKHPLAHLGN